MTVRALKGLANTFGAVAVAMAIAGALLRLFGPAHQQTFNIGSPLDFLAEAAAASTYAVVGVILAQRLPRHPVPWIFLGIGIVFAGVVITWAYAVVALSQPPGQLELPLAREGLVVTSALLQPVGLTLLVALLALFPSGRTFDRLGRQVLRAVPITAALFGLGIALTPNDVGIFTGVRNPLALRMDPTLGRLLTVMGVAGTVFLAAAACVSLRNRYGASDRVTREQIRWLLWAGGIAVFLAGGVFLLIVVAPNILNTPAEAVVLVAFSIGGAVVPVGCAFAIRRNHLYDIDRLLSQTFVYGALVAIVAGLYAGLVGVFEQVSVAFTGSAGSSSLTVVLTAVILAVTFEPLKKRLEAYAERFREVPDSGHDHEHEPHAAADHSHGLPPPDDAWVEAIAQRVAAILRSEGRTNPN